MTGTRGTTRGGWEKYDGWDGHGQESYGGAGYDAASGSGYSAGAGMCSYTVATGDTLAWVAQSMGATTYDIVSANGIANPDFIYVGQVLSNPSCSTGGAGYGAAYETGATYESGAGYGAAYDTGADVAYTAPDYAAAMSEYQVAASYAESDGAAYAAADYVTGDVAMGAGADYPAGYAPLETAGLASDPYAGAAQDRFQGYAGGQDAYGPVDALPYADAALPGAGYEAVAMTPAGSSYAVQAGDTLSQIAAANGLAVRTLMDANGIANPNIIFVGQVLILP
ncbi:MAG: LysM peptidoglycan-binding domain-containing protein [Anaerolineales bacterium]|nr:LysM peptidoglycan-binding domain-containing protein [Anaerolineales bacterium]